jgi:hypothetical protein
MFAEIKETCKSSDNILTIIINIFSLKNILNILTIVFFVVSLFFRIVNLNTKTISLLEKKDEDFIDSYFISWSYNVSYLIESLLFFLSSIKLTLFLKISDYINLFYTTLNKGILSFIQYSFFFLLILFGYTIVAHIIWGPYIDGFQSLSDSFIMTLLFSMGI